MRETVKANKVGDKIEKGLLKFRQCSIPSLLHYASSHLAFPHFLLSFPVSLPSPRWDHMTGATYITVFSKNTSAERFMRDERAATHSSSDVAGWKRGVYVHSQALSCTRLGLQLNVQAHDRVQTCRKPIGWKSGEHVLFECDCALWVCVCDASHSYSPKGSQSCMQTEHTDLDFLLF